MKRAITLAAAVLLSVTACTPPSPPTVTAAATITPKATASPESVDDPAPWSPTPTPNPECVPLSPAMLQAIAAGAKNPEKFLPLSGMAVRSRTYHRNTLYVIYLSFALKGDGGRPVGGGWVATGLEPGSATIYNGEATAPIFTVFPSSRTDWPELRMNDDAWKIAADCVGL